MQGRQQCACVSSMHSYRKSFFIIHESILYLNLCIARVRFEGVATGNSKLLIEEIERPSGWVNVQDFSITLLRSHCILLVVVDLVLFCIQKPEPFKPYVHFPFMSILPLLTREYRFHSKAQNSCLLFLGSGFLIHLCLAEPAT
jgi:hypothetical protein